MPKTPKTRKTPKNPQDLYNFKIYIRKVLKQVHPDTEILGVALDEINFLVHDIANRIIKEAIRLLKSEGRKTLSSREVQSAVRIVLPGELAKHAQSEGIKAIYKYTQVQTGNNKDRSKRAGLVFPIARTENIIREHNYKMNIGEGAPVYLAAVLEYIAAELCELSGNVARDKKRTRIRPREIFLAIMNDIELSVLFKKTELPGVGVLPYIHLKLLPKAKSK